VHIEPNAQSIKTKLVLVTGELKASKTNPYPLVLDAPLSTHWLAFALWCALRLIRGDAYRWQPSPLPTLTLLAKDGAYR